MDERNDVHNMYTQMIEEQQTRINALTEEMNIKEVNFISIDNNMCNRWKAKISFKYLISKRCGKYLRTIFSV